MSSAPHAGLLAEVPRTRARTVLAAMAMLQFLIAVDVTVVNVALPSIGDEFATSTRQLTWVVVGYTIAGGGLLIFGGRLGDVLGRRRTLIAGAALFGCASLLAGLAPSFELLVAARLLQGAGEALALPAAMAVIVLLFPEGEQRSQALSIWAAVASTGLVAGFVLSGVITELLGWRWIFLVNVPVIILVVAAVLTLLPQDGIAGRGPVDLPGSFLLILAPLLFVVGVNQIGEGWIGPAALLGAPACAALFIAAERRAARPLVPPGALRHGGRVRANLATALLSAALSTSFLLFTLHLQERAGLGPLATGLTLLPLAVCLVIAVAFVPKLMARWGARRCALAGIATTALGVIAIAAVATSGTSATAMIPAMLLVATGMAAGLVALQYAAVTGATGEDAGLASGVQRAADQLGGSSGVALYIGIGFAPALSDHDPFLISSGLAVLGLLAGGLIAAHHHHPDEQ